MQFSKLNIFELTLKEESEEEEEMTRRIAPTPLYELMVWSEMSENKTVRYPEKDRFKFVT